MIHGDSPQDYWNRLELIQSKKRIIKITRDIKEELMMVCWHPTKVQKMLDLYGIDFEDYV
jgi:predicted glycosyltransferase